MKSDIILSGVGGQGILSIAAIIGQAAIRLGLNIKQAEVHGMSQRGGDVQSNLRISSEPIYSDLIAHASADVIISLEPMEALRYLPYLSDRGWIVVNSAPFINIANYPDVEALHRELRALPRVIMIDIDSIAKECGTNRAANIVLLGAASVALGIEQHDLEYGIEQVFGSKGRQVVETNITALRAGRQAALKNDIHE